jgi:TRAP transporter TAXI family solute receptor
LEEAAMACGMRAIVFYCTFLLFSSLAYAQGLDSAPQPGTQAHTSKVEQVNGGTVGVISGAITGTYARIATDMSAVLDSGNELRILPIIGKGSVQNITDILYLRGIDVGIVQSDVLQYIRETGSYPDISNRIAFITKLYNEEVHILTRTDIKAVEDLRGKKVNFANEGSGTYMTASVVFKKLGIDVEITTFDYELALENLKKGEIDALFYVAGKPAPIFSTIKPEDGLQLLNVDLTPELAETYLPGEFTTTDYPGLVPPNQEVKTVAVGAVMAVFNWKRAHGRYNKIKRFVDAFFGNFDQFLQAPRHPKWQEVNLAADVPGWKRFEPARAWLESHQGEATNQVSEFKTFLETTGQATALSAEDQEELFKRFLKWKDTRAQ